MFGPAGRANVQAIRAVPTQAYTSEPTVTPELIAILAVGATLIGVGATLIGLLLALWRDARADTQALREEVRADRQSFREEFRADFQSFREEVRGDLANLRTDVPGADRAHVTGRRRHRRPLRRPRSPQRRRLTDPTRAFPNQRSPLR